MMHMFFNNLTTEIYKFLKELSHKMLNSESIGLGLKIIESVN